MVKRCKNLRVFLSLLAVYLVVSLSCQLPTFLGNEKVAQMSSSERYYTIDPDTIVEALVKGKTDVFQPQIVTPEEPIPGKQVQWSQNDYFKIVDALNKFVWNETVEGWQLDNMVFRLDCVDVNNGPQYADIQFFKIINTRERESRLLRDFWIDPSKDQVSWHEVEKYPNIWGLDTIDLAQLKIPAEEALRIAEKNGGNKARSAVQNACTIYLLLAPGSETYSGWQVSYFGHDSKDLYTIHIDPMTGKYDIIKMLK